MKQKIAICVGHSRTGDNGAESVTGVSEWTFNFKMAEQIQSILQARGFDVIVVSHYEGNGYTAAMKWVATYLKLQKITVAVELHFNASDNPAARGHEWLCWHSSVRGAVLANSLRKAYRSLFASSADRGVKPIDSSDRGALFLSLTQCPAVICEPFFGTNPLEWSTATAQTHQIALSIASGIETYLLTL